MANSSITAKRQRVLREAAILGITAARVKRVLDTLYHMAVDEKNEQAAKLYLEHAIGKPTQSVQLESHNFEHRVVSVVNESDKMRQALHETARKFFLEKYNRDKDFVVIQAKHEHLKAIAAAPDLVDPPEPTSVDEPNEEVLNETN